MNNRPAICWTNKEMEVMQVEITAIIEAVAVLVAAVVTVVVVPYIKSKTTTGQQERINAWVRVAVAAAEQIYNSAGQGEKKKSYVLAFLKSHGITLDEQRVNVLIEAAVYALNNGIVEV
jgi:F0F1-type ATP synthase membrane subunit a